MTVLASAKLTTRTRPRAQEAAPAIKEILTTHAAVCPTCELETRVKAGLEATIHGGCAHFAEVQKRGDEISVLFREAVQ